ncbi:uncharacterized protein LOC112693165 isoform X2 [Sipha flava]|uniref:Uncharacterized protein LOC112693165 isoform X2 n=1 Tax=Sipha flava TaxID=143950 RepID=A0A8B8GMS7_9HEMI|nr:uncharacterized protein LOC112693165 isoform X2 [Sipha flava]
MDPFKKYLNNTALFSIVSDYITNYVNFINEKPLSFVLAPLTLTIFCYYIYVYIRKFYPIYVNCWFCNANFKVAFEDRFEYTCIECEQFNGFKKDGSYSKIIPEQHDQRLNRTVFTVIQNNVKESKNGLCHTCNIIQEMKIKQLAAFTPINEKNFDREIEIFKENLEETLKLCSKCYIFSKKILSLQEQRYSLKSTRINKQDIRDVSDWPNVCSLFLSTIVLLLSSSAKNYLSDWTANFIDTSIFDNSVVIVSYSIGMASLGGILCQVYHCLTTMDKLSGIIMLLWSILFVINNFEIFINFKPKLLVSVFIVLLSSTSILKNLTRKQKIRQTSIKLEDETYEFPTANYYDISKNSVSPKTQLRENHFLPGSTSNQFIVRLPKFKVARVFNEKIFLEAIPTSVQYTTRDEYDCDINTQYITSRQNVQMDRVKTAMNQK